MDKAYIYTTVMTLELGSIGLKYQGSHTNPFQQSTQTMLMFLTAMFCHAVASMADLSSQTTMIIFHLSGVVGCETLLWILLTEFWWWYVINLFLLLVTSFCFSISANCMDSISSGLGRFRGTHGTNPDAARSPNAELQEAVTMQL